MFKVIFSKQAAKFYQIVDDHIAKEINKAIEYISQNPYYGNNIKKLKGNLKEFHRYRVGSYRLVYSIESEIKIVSIVWIGLRKDAY